jgi:hypothetical protein
VATCVRDGDFDSRERLPKLEAGCVLCLCAILESLAVGEFYVRVFLTRAMWGGQCFLFEVDSCEARLRAEAEARVQQPEHRVAEKLTMCVYVYLYIYDITYSIL